MPTKTLTPEQLRERAADLQRQAAEAQALVDAAAAEEREREWQKQLDADHALVDSFDAKALDQAVDEARVEFAHAVADMAVTKALAAYIAAQTARNWAWLDLTSAQGRLGLSQEGAREATEEIVKLQDYIEVAAQRMAADQVAAQRTPTEQA